MTELQAAHILWQVLSALEHLHGCRVAHRDLKLSNMFLAQDGTVKVGDLGLASHLPTASCRRRSTCGSLNWMAPEVLRPRSSGYGLEVDIWALGVMLFTLLVGRPPFAVGRDSASAEELLPQTTCGRILQGRYCMPGADEVVLGPEACDLVARLLVVDPAARPSLEQLRSHAFFRLHLGALAVPGALVPRSPSEQQNLSPPERTGSAWEDRLSLATSEDLGLRPSLSIQSQMVLVPPPVDIRLLLCNAGRAALAAHAAGVVGSSTACDSTSGSYMELSQSEQCSVLTAASTTTTNATGGRGGGSGDPRWLQLGPPDALSSQLTRSHDPARTRSHPQLPPYRMSEQSTGATSGRQLQGGKGKFFARGSVPNSPFVDPSLFIDGMDPGHSRSVSSLTHGTSSASPQGMLINGGNAIAGPFPCTGSAPGLPAQLLANSMLSSSPQPSQLHYHSHHFHAFQHSLQQQQPQLPQRQQPQTAFTPGQDTQQLFLTLPPTPFLCAPEASKALPGGGADQHLPAQGLMDLSQAHPQPRGGEWQELDIGDAPGSYAEGLIMPLDRQASWMRSCTGLSRHTSAALSSRSTSQRSSAFVASFVHTALGPQHVHAHAPPLNSHTQLDQQRRHQHDDQRLQRQQQLQSQHRQGSLLPGQRRRTVDSTISPIALNSGFPDRVEDTDTDAPVCDNANSGAGVVTGMPPQAISVLCTAFLSQRNSFQQATAAQARRLQASRSTHARNGMRIAAGLRSVPGGCGLDEEQENDASSDTVRSYADSLEAMLLGRQAGINGAVAAAMLSVPAPVMPSCMARYGNIHALGQGHHGAGHAANPNPLTHSRASRAVPTPTAPIVLRHARSSIGAPPLVRRCAPIYGGDITHVTGHDSASRAVPLLPSECRAAPLTPWLQADIASSLHSAPCVAAISSGPTSSQIAGPFPSTSGVGDAALAGGCIASCIPAAKSLPADLEPPRLAMALPPYQRPPSSAQQHSISAATTPQHSEPLSLAVFAIQQSKGLPIRGRSSTPNGFDGAILDVGLCICAGADSPQREGSGWSSGQVQLRAAGTGPGSGVIPAALHAAASGMDPMAQAIEAERAVANLEMFAGDPTVTTHIGAATAPGTSAGPAFAGMSQEEAAIRENHKSLSQCPQPQEEMLQYPQQQSSELIARALGPPMRMSYPSSSHIRTVAGELMPSPAPAAEGCLAWERHRNCEPGSRQAGVQAPATIIDGNVCAGAAAPQPLSASGHDVVGVGPGRQFTAVWHTESVSLEADRDAVKPSLKPAVDALGQQTQQNSLFQMLRTPHLHRACGLAKDQGQYQGRKQELAKGVHQEEQHGSKSYKESGSGFSFRMYMHPWRAMALARVRQEAMRLHRMQHEEVADVEVEGHTQPLEEWGDTSSRSAISAAPLEPLRLQVCGVSTRLTPSPQNPDVTTATAAAALGAASSSTGVAATSIAAVGGDGPIYPGSAAASLGGSGSLGDMAAAPRSDSTKQVITSGLPSRAVQPPATVAATSASSTRTEELPWTASAPAAVRSHTSPATASRAVAAWLGAASPAATGAPLTARCAAVVTASCNHPCKQAPNAFDRLGLCCRILPGSCACGGVPVSPKGSDTSPHRYGDCAVGSRSPGPKRRVASLDVERVLRHLESSDPDDLAMATVLPLDDTSMPQSTMTMRSSLAADINGKLRGACTGASRADSKSPRHGKPPEEVDRCLPSAGASPNGALTQLRPASLGSSQPHGSLDRAVEAQTVLRPGRDPAPSAMISPSPPHDDEGGAVLGLGAIVISAMHLTAAGDHVRSSTAETGLDKQDFRLNAPVDSQRASMDILLHALGCPEVADATEAPAAAATLSVSGGPASTQNAMARFASRSVHEDARTPPGVPHSVMSVPQVHDCTLEVKPTPRSSSCSDRPAANSECTSEKRGPFWPPLPADVAVLPRSLPGPAQFSTCRLSMSATGMRDVSGGEMATDAVPEMDPDALAELASRLRFKSFKDAMGSRTGSFTYRPSRMMPAGQRSPSRRTLCSTVGQPGVSDLVADEVPVSNGGGHGGGGTAGTAPSAPAPGRSRSHVHPRDVLMVKWLDYSSKYGLSYVLSNGAVGVLFRDGTQLLRARGDAYAWLLGAPADATAAASKRGTLMQWQGPLPQAQPLLLQEGPQAAGHRDRHHHDVSKKLRLLRTFESMLLGSEVGNGPGAATQSDGIANREPHVHLARHQGGERERALMRDKVQQPQGMPTHDTGPTATAPLPPPPLQPPPVFVTWWTRTKKALVLCLSSGSLQVLFCDGSELVVREDEDEVEYLARDGRRTSCSLSSVQLASPKNSLSKRIDYTIMLIQSRAGKH
ncbi:hypothetical protein Vretifemale_15020 [Volvox reticuliferus]|nr:hypothetical protein Vretifemale_15020 [Volvox reticuliferus]